MTIPPSTAIIAFAVLFGHPVLQMALIGFGARSFAVTPWGRIATYASAAVAGGLVAWALHRVPAPAPEQLHPDWRMPPDTPAPKMIPRNIGGTGDKEVANLMADPDALKQGSIIDRSKTRSILFGGGEASVILHKQDLSTLVDVLDVARNKETDHPKNRYTVGMWSKLVNMKPEELRELRNKIDTMRELANLDENSQILLRVGSPGTNFATRIDEKSGRPIFPRPAEDGQDR